jgi:hypothetical protein
VTTALAIARPRVLVLIAMAAAIVLAAVLLPPIAQPPEYHRFADARTLAGIPNFWNVVSNLAILAAGSAGLRLVARQPASTALAVPAARAAYAVLFAGFILTALGSAYYHWAPDNARLVWDRLPMTIAFMGLVGVLVAERIDARTGMRLLVPLVLLGAASVAWWQWTMQRGADDVGPYVAVQFGSIALVLLIAALFPKPAASGTGIFAVGVLYAAGKVAEIFDAQIFAAGGMLSGHTLKHLLVGAAGFALIRMAHSVATPGLARSSAMR